MGHVMGAFHAVLDPAKVLSTPLAAEFQDQFTCFGTGGHGSSEIPLTLSEKISFYNASLLSVLQIWKGI